MTIARDKYRVILTKVSTGVIEVEAVNDEEAKDIALEQYHKGNVWFATPEVCALPKYIRDFSYNNGNHHTGCVCNSGR